MNLGRDIVLDILRTEGVTHIFGNPGTTELSLIDALLKSGEFNYILALQESSAVGMADGYARATNRPAFLNLHAAAGLGHGLGALTNAAYTNVPLVVTVGQQDYRHILDEPWLTGDVVGLAKPVSKWAHEVRTVDEIGPVLRRAFKDANSYPKGPVFVSLPFHFMDEEAGTPVPQRSEVHGAPVASGLGRLAEELAACAADEIAIIACDEISASEAHAEVVQLAEALGADVVGAPVHDSVVFPTSHPLWTAMLPPDAAGTRQILAPYKKVLVLGDRGFMTLVFSGTPIPDGLEILHLSADPKTVAYTYPTRCGLVGDIKASLRRLLPMLSQSNQDDIAKRIQEKSEIAATKAREDDERLEKSFTDRPMLPEVAAYAVAKSLPSQTIVVDEAPAVTGFFRKFYKTTDRLQYNFSKGGGLGWAMPAAVGISLHENEKRTVCLVGDGAAMYSPQAMWTAANEKLPVTFIVFNNTEYGVLKNFLRQHYSSDSGQDDFIGMDLTDPPIDYLSLARSMGVPGVRVEDARDVKAAIEDAIGQPGTNMIEVVIASSNGSR